MSSRCDILVIGYGSDLRGDDALGPMAADIIEGWRVDCLRSISCQQLAPELAAEIADAKRVLFIDACAARIPGPQIRPVKPKGQDNRIGHTGGPGELLGLARTTYGRCAHGWILELPATGFEMGAALSQAARYGLSEGLDLVCDWIAGLPTSPIENWVLCTR